MKEGGRGVIVLLVKDIFMMFVVQMKRNNKPCACWLLKMFYFSFLKKKPDELSFKKTRSNVFLIILGICLRIRTTYQIAGKYNKTPFKSSKKYSLRIMILLKWVEKKL